MNEARKRLPNRRAAETFSLRHGDVNVKYHVTVGFFSDGSVGEIFTSTNKAGTAVDALARDVAILLSLCLQHDCPMSTIAAALTREGDGTASTIAGAIADRLTGPDAF